MSNARLKAMAKILVQASNTDMDWYFELLKSINKLDRETRAKLQEILNDLYKSLNK